MDTEECEDFDIRDLDEREPCQTMQDSLMEERKFHNKSHEKTISMILPLTTRSTHSQALLTIRKTKTNDPMNQSNSVQDGRESEIPAYHMDA